MRHQGTPSAPLRGARKDPIGVFCSTRLSIDDQMLKKMRSGGAPHYRSKHWAYAVTTRVLPKRWHMAPTTISTSTLSGRTRTRKARRGSSPEHTPSLDLDQLIAASPIWSRPSPVRYQGFLR